MAVMALAIAGLGWQNLPLEMAARISGEHASRAVWTVQVRITAGAIARTQAFLGNGVLELGTFLAVIAGVVAGASWRTSFKDGKAGRARSFWVCRSLA